MRHTAVVFVIAVMAACAPAPSSNDTQRAAGERMLQEATSQTGMPALTNFRERKLLKDILEMRDQDGLVTYTYVFSEQTGQLRFLCNSIGYGIPYATQYTAPESVQSFYLDSASAGDKWGRERLPQADPNGLFSPASAEGTWVQCSDPGKAGAVRTLYIEPRIIVSPFKLDGRPEQE